MQVSVLVDRINGNGYRARGMEPFALSAEGSTREEALARLRKDIETLLQNGTEVVTLEIGLDPHPLAEFAGMFKDDPDFVDVLKTMADNRKSGNQGSGSI